MEVLFPLSVVRKLPHLEEIKVVCCKLMCGIIEVDDSGKVELCNLRVLKLRDLPCIKNFLNVGSSPSSSTSHDQVSTQIAFFNGKRVSIPSLESLTLEALPDMQEIWSDESPLGLSNLQSLVVVQCKSLLKVFSFGSLLKLRKLHTLTIKDCVSVQEIFDLDGPSGSGNVATLFELATLELSKMRSLRRIWNKNPHGTMSLHNLKKLVVEDCENLEFMFFPSMIKSLAHLRDLTVSNCKKMEAIIMEEEEVGMEIVETLEFPMLTNLCLKQLESLMCFSHGKGSRETWSQGHVQSRFIALFNREVAFPRLETLEIMSLDNFGFMFLPSSVTSFTQLKELKVWFCEKMKAIIVEEEGLRMETSETLTFPMLTDLHLSNLTSLRCFSHGKYSQEARSQDRVKPHSTALFDGEVAFPSLETLDIVVVDNIENIWNNQVAADSFHNLKSLYVCHCHKLVNLVPSHILGRLSSLERLEAKNCGSLVVVFELQPPNPPDRHPTTCSLLKELILIELPELKCVWDEELHCQVIFQCLRSISVSRCKSLTSLFPASIANDLIQLEDLKIDECGIANSWRMKKA
ncbi:uncharacterized protein LOC120295752 isoform X2 [Eucalyptus grandis]|uniref:uncharacterized protein LOC120295752 isoform X2 n=1 Tax=Eucalyptus grandis TaxID=71139 RepID=UPI00192EB50F|nr:uncharacterized protein LOC120295752 isoform X2 [Eucalyptus grandis]